MCRQVAMLLLLLASVGVFSSVSAAKVATDGDAYYSALPAADDAIMMPGSVSKTLRLSMTASHGDSSRKLLQSTYAISYAGCYSDDVGRSFDYFAGPKTVVECAQTALNAGHLTFSMQCPSCTVEGDTAECWYGDKGVLGSSPYAKISDSNCGSSGLGGPWISAVWSLSSGSDGGSPSAPSSPSGNDNPWLVEHNIRRQKYHAMYGVDYVPVKWSSSIASSAQSYANKLIAIPGCVIKHGYQGDDYGGENLASTTASSASADSVLTMWAEDEANLSGYDAGHFIQVVWRATKYIGCAQAKKSGCTISVCRYIKPGNCGGFDKQLMIQSDSGCGPECPAEGCF